MRRNTRIRESFREVHHYTTTAHQSAPVRSNSGQTVSGSPTGNGANQTLRRDMPDAPDKRAAYPRMNTNTNRRLGGPSVYYRAREGYGQ